MSVEGMHFITCVITLTLTQTFALTENHFFNVCECMFVYIYSACISDSVENTGFISSVSLLIDLLTLYIGIASACIVIVHSRPQGNTVANQVRPFLPLWSVKVCPVGNNVCFCHTPQYAYMGLCSPFLQCIVQMWWVYGIETLELTEFWPSPQKTTHCSV